MDEMDVQNSPRQEHGKSLRLGIDAGQTHLEAVLVDAADAVIWRGIGGPSHIQGADLKEVFASSVDEALQDFPRAVLHDVVSVGVGVTGFTIPGKPEAVHTVLSERLPKADIYADSDVVTAYYGASRGTDGVLVIAGTGSIAYGRRGESSVRLGGYGYLCGDEGAGDWIGLTAIRRAIWAREERGLRTVLEEVVAHHFEVDDVRKVPGVIYARSTVDVRKIAQLTRLVSEAAKTGDELAQTVLREAGQWLGRLAIAVAEQLPRSRADRGVPLPVYRLGGVWESGDFVKAGFDEAIRNLGDSVSLLDTVPRADAATGAAWYAKTREPVE